MKPPDVHYARSGATAIAYQVVGDAPRDVVWVRGNINDMLSSWDEQTFAPFVADVTKFARLILFDKRGSGLSDPVTAGITLETRMDDVRAVMEAAGSQRATILAGFEGARLAVMFAATYPERTEGLVLVDPEARTLRTPDYPWGETEEEHRAGLVDIAARWGTREFLEEMLRDGNAVLADDPAHLEWWITNQRRGASPATALAWFRMIADADVTDVLSTVRVPTVVIRAFLPAEQIRYVSDRIAGARFLDADAEHGHIPRSRARGIVLGELEAMGTGAQPEEDRVLASVLFTDLVGSTERAAAAGDRAWKDVLERHHALVRRELARHRGMEVDTAGDGFFATFDGPARAIRCARAIGEAVRELGLEVRAGIHTGECEVAAGKVAGIAVSIGARVSALAQPGEVLVSSTVKDLVAGSGIEFEDRGERELKGVPGRWRLYAVA